MLLAMNQSTLRERLHEYIDTADERHLTAIYVLVENEMADDDLYDEATLNMLYERREKHLSGESKSYSAQESLRRIREHKK